MEEAQRLRSRILTVFEDADRDPKLVEKGALNFVIVGGGPTGTEMAGALADMINLTMTAEYTDLAVKHARIYLVDHGHALLGAFSGEGPRLCRQGSPAEGCAITAGDSGEGGSSRSCSAFRWHVDSNTHGGLGGWADGLASGGKCGVAAGARRPDRSAGRTSRLKDSPEFTYWATSRTFPARMVSRLPQLASVAQQCGEWTAKNILAEIAVKSSNSVPLSRQGNHGDDRTRRGRGGNREEAA